jgi:poly-gamma-glutamate synthesis protein (capsule biosynthesis protein)
MPTLELRGSAPVPSDAERRPVTLIFGGDVSFGRTTGRRLVDDPSYSPLSALIPLFYTAHVRFANLESPLSDQKGETEHPSRPLTFNGPPSGARALARAGFDIVSIANNHIWDYGRAAYLETIEHLEAQEIAYTGGAKPGADPFTPTVVVRRGWSIAWFAVTGVWNPGTIEPDAAALVSFRHQASIFERLRRARSDHDLVIVSHHGGKEYSERIAPEQRAFAHAAMQAGADLVIGHHPHVPQGVEWFEARPAFYSLGNLVFEQHRDHPWTGRGFLARISFEPVRPTRPSKVELCPYVIVSGMPKPLSESPGREPLRPFIRYLRRVLANADTTRLGPPRDFGCMPIEPISAE